MGAGHNLKRGQQIAQVKASETSVDPKTFAKNGTPETRIPPTKAPAKVQGRKAKPGSSKSEKRSVTGRGEAMKTPNLIGTWSPR